MSTNPLADAAAAQRAEMRAAIPKPSPAVRYPQLDAEGHEVLVVRVNGKIAGKLVPGR